MRLLLPILTLTLLAPARADNLVLTSPPSPNLPFTLSPATTVITDPLNKNGLPDYAAALNARYGKNVTPDNNAAIPWLHLFGDKIFPPDTRAATLKALGAQPTPADAPTWSNKNLPPNLAAAAAQLWKPADFPPLAAFLNDRAPFLDRLVALSQKPRFFWPAVISPDNLSLSIGPSYAGAADLFRALAARATLRAAANDFPGFQQDTLALLRLSQLLGTGPTLLDRVVADQAQSLAADALSAAANAHTFTPDQWQKLATAAANIQPIDNIEPMDITQRFLYLRAQQLTATGALDHLPKDPMDIDDPVFDAIIAHRQNLDWNLILERDNDDWNDCIKIQPMPPTPAHDAALKAFTQRLRQSIDIAVNDPDHFNPHANESWQAYTLRAQAWSIGISPIAHTNDTLAKRQDAAAATWTRLQNLLAPNLPPYTNPASEEFS